MGSEAGTARGRTTAVNLHRPRNQAVALLIALGLGCQGQAGNVAMQSSGDSAAAITPAAPSGAPSPHASKQAAAMSKEAPVAREQAASTDYRALGAQIVQTIAEQYHDPQRAVAWARLHADYAAAIHTREDFDRETTRRLAELETSHTAYFSPDDPRNAELRSIFDHLFPALQTDSVGAQFIEHDGGWVTARVFPGGPAAAAGLLRGDRVVSADGAPFAPGRAFSGHAGRAVTLSLLRAQGKLEQTISVVPERTAPKAEWLSAQRTASRVIDHAGRRIAYAWLWSCAGTEHQELLEDFIVDAAGADALVVDFRDGWGGCNPGFVNLFNPVVPALQIKRRDGESGYLPAWRGPLVLLVNGRASSGKEIVAHSLQRAGRATVVGTPTAGAVAAGKPNALADGSLLYVAVGRILVDGVELEGHPIVPDVVAPDALVYAAGRDPQLERALDVAASLAAQARAGERRPPPRTARPSRPQDDPRMATARGR